MSDALSGTKLTRGIFAAAALAAAAFLSGCVAFNAAGRPVGVQEGITSRILDPMTLEEVQDPDIPAYPPAVPPALLAE